MLAGSGQVGHHLLEVIGWEVAAQNEGLIGRVPQDPHLGGCDHPDILEAVDGPCATVCSNLGHVDTTIDGKQREPEQPVGIEPMLGFG